MDCNCQDIETDKFLSTTSPYPVENSGIIKFDNYKNCCGASNFEIIKNNIIFPQAGIYQATYSANIEFDPKTINFINNIKIAAKLNKKKIPDSLSEICYNPLDLNPVSPIQPIPPPPKSELPLVQPPANTPKNPYKPPTILSSDNQFVVNSFRNILPNLFKSKYVACPADGKSHYIIQMVPTTQDFGVLNPLMANYPFGPVPVWGYRDASKSTNTGLYPGPTFMVNSGEKITVLWENKLVDSNGNPLATFLPYDYTIIQASTVASITPNPATYPALLPNQPAPPKFLPIIPTVPHLAGGFTDYTSNGYPEAWFTPNFQYTGPHFTNRIYTYNNCQQAANLWYHDNTLGYSRLNIYSGLFGNYIISDPNEKYLMENNLIPSYPFEYPLIIQDKSFNTDGSIYYPTNSTEVPYTNPGSVSVIPEFYGLFCIINGKLWPVLAVEPTLYRFRFLNASQSRFYNIFISYFDDESNFTGEHIISMIQIGGDSGLADKPNNISNFIFPVGSRMDIIIDFSEYKNKSIYLRNNAPAPYPEGISTNLPMGLQYLMKFTISNKKICNPIKLTKNLRPISGINIIPDLDRYCKLSIFELGDPNPTGSFYPGDLYGRITPLLGNPYSGSYFWSDPLTEYIKLGEAVEFEIYNITGNSNPIHFQGGNFYIKNRQYFFATVNESTGQLSNIQFGSEIFEPYSYEKNIPLDVVVAYPAGVYTSSGEFVPVPVSPDPTVLFAPAPPFITVPPYPTGMVTRIIMKFNIPGLFAWNSNMFENQDHGAQRPLAVIPPLLAFPISKTFAFVARDCSKLKILTRFDPPNNFAIIKNFNLTISKQGDRPCCK